MLFSVALAALVGSASSAILWDGRFNTFSSSTDLNNWSWSNQVGPYQYYIVRKLPMLALLLHTDQVQHGPSAVTSYINLSPSYKNPADSGSTQGAKFTLDSTSFWNGQTMRRTELIPQTTAAIASGKVWYHFSMMRSATNAPSIYREHQINFFESHFTEMKSGWISGAAGNSNPALQWFVGGQSKWSVNWDAGVWHNVAYEIVSSHLCLHSSPNMLRDQGLLRQHRCLLALDRFRPPHPHCSSRQCFDLLEWCRLASRCSRTSRFRPSRHQ